jgi:hypothetical protein
MVIPLLAKGFSPPLIEANAELTGISMCHICTLWLPLKPPLKPLYGINLPPPAESQLVEI